MATNDSSVPNAEAGLTAGYSSTGNQAADDVSNRTGGEYGQSDAARETGTSSSQTNSAWHDARDDYEKDEGLSDRHSGGWFS
jgi:hypothetical protein